MELTGKKLEEVLNTELVGKDVGYSHCRFTNALLGVIRSFAKEAGLDESAFSCKDQGQSSAYLPYLQRRYFRRRQFSKAKRRTSFRKL